MQNNIQIMKEDTEILDTFSHIIDKDTFAELLLCNSPNSLLSYLHKPSYSRNVVMIYSHTRHRVKGFNTLYTPATLTNQHPAKCDF